jgi:hypothetical protein
MPLEPTRTIAELKELRSFTADENEVGPVAFKETWVKAARLLAKELEEFRGPKDNTIKRVTHSARAPRWLVGVPGAKPEDPRKRYSLFDFRPVFCY